MLKNIPGRDNTCANTLRVFLPQYFKVYGYSDAGYMKPFEQQIQSSCYYQGYIEGYPKSVAILSTCSGLRGILQLKNVTYGIEPLEPSVGFEHVIYQVKPKKTGSSLYAEVNMETKDMSYKIQSLQPFTELPRYIEMHVIVEKNLYDHLGSDTFVVTQKILQLIGFTNAIFTSLNITIILSSLELWIDENKIPITGDANELLHKFLKWKRSYLVLRPHDVAFLLVYRERSKYVGATFQGKICDREYGGGIAMHLKTISLESLAVIIAQLLSLSMEIDYDDISKCQCSGAVCVMNPEAIYSSGVKNFSNCSMEDFTHFISKPKSQCLQNHPRLDPSYKDAVCGNQKLEDGEECDCGTTEQCLDEENVCCDPATCTIKVGFNCISGLCCSDCRYKDKGETCRDSLDDCDLPEYCNGSVASCPDDVYILDGFPCGNNEWFCVDGKCLSLTQQCQELFGEGINSGPEECYNYLNAMTDQSGNCGRDDTGYKKCQPKDLMCGKLICKYESKLSLTISDAITFYTNVNENICISLEYSSGHEKYTKMWVKDGTVCATNKVCKDKECVDNYLDFDCPPQKCHSHGICNNKKNCHCNFGFLPPNCENALDSWPGGSIDSGNFPPDRTARIPEKFYTETDYPSKPLRWPFFLLIPFCIVLSAMITILVKVFVQRKKWKTEEYTSDEEFESESESKSNLENKESIIS
ncbi:disintegrin and metalloproteinase domain-containing protein 2 [Saccopteryx bilineata]|uniref:disintegrin and metalloproteinase domain-containing protein 2 n=1 Tax=Saccopteryx bilineata TaxID=59482 RepID=UPI00338EEF74